MAEAIVLGVLALVPAWIVLAKGGRRAVQKMRNKGGRGERELIAGGAKMYNEGLKNELRYGNYSSGSLTQQLDRSLAEFNRTLYRQTELYEQGRALDRQERIHASNNFTSIIHRQFDAMDRQNEAWSGVLDLVRYQSHMLWIFTIALAYLAFTAGFYSGKVEWMQGILTTVDLDLNIPPFESIPGRAPLIAVLLFPWTVLAWLGSKIRNAFIWLRISVLFTWPWYYLKLSVFAVYRVVAKAGSLIKTIVFSLAFYIWLGLCMTFDLFMKLMGIVLWVPMRCYAYIARFVHYCGNLCSQLISTAGPGFSVVIFILAILGVVFLVLIGIGAYENAKSRKQAARRRKHL